MRIIGLDVCKDSVVAWALESLPKNFRQYFREHKRGKEDPLKLYANHAGVSALLALKPDAVVMEPTGIHYSWIWAHVCAKENITVLWVGHQEAVHYRKQHKLPDKNDQADALALAAYALFHWGQDDFFLSFEAGAIAKIRELWLQLQSLNRVQSPIINRARQQLAREFPEAALKKSPVASDGLPPLWAWLAQRERHLKVKRCYYDRLYAQSIASSYGIEISPFTRRLAAMLCDLAAWESEIEREIASILTTRAFADYQRVFVQFGIPPRSQALLLSQIYPMSKFDSLGRFKRRLGLAKDENSSGDKESMNTGSGSKLCRSQLYLWVLDVIAPARARPDNDIGKKLGEFYDARKSQFQDNPELWKQKAIERLQQQALRELKRQLSANLMSLLPKESAATVTSTLDLSMQAISMSLMAGLSTELHDKANVREVKKGFGNLIVSQTAAYGLRLLFKELKKATDT